MTFSEYWELATKLNDCMYNINYYEYLNNNYNRDKAYKDIIETPEKVISELINIINNLVEE